MIILISEIQTKLYYIFNMILIFKNFMKKIDMKIQQIVLFFKIKEFIIKVYLWQLIYICVCVCMYVYRLSMTLNINLNFLFGLVSLFNSISTFMDYLIPKPPL